MKTNQPKWRYVDYVGDVNYLDYGGGIILEDKTGVYCPELELYELDETTNIVTIGRILLEKSAREWFMNDTHLLPFCNSMDVSPGKFYRMIMNDNILERATAYYELTLYYGWYEFDQYPLTMTYKQAEQRINNLKRYGRPTKKLYR